jgi:hypothetical protein
MFSNTSFDFYITSINLTEKTESVQMWNHVTLRLYANYAIFIAKQQQQQ